MTVPTNRSPLPSYKRTSAGLPGAPGIATAYMDTAGMTLISAISPLSSWLRRWPNRVRIVRMPGWITLWSPCMVGAGALALSIANLSGPVRRPVVGSKVLDHLKIIDVNMDRMLVVVVVDEPPLLD